LAAFFVWFSGYGFANGFAIKYIVLAKIGDRPQTKEHP
jgi:hypothetical protein